MDATILALKKINFDHCSFFTLKSIQKSYAISQEHWQGLSKLPVHFNYKINTEINRWSGFLLAGTQHFPLFEFMKDFFYSYWKKENYVIDYLFVDYVIALAYDTMPHVKEMIDKTICIEGDKFALEKILNTEYSEHQINEYINTPFHKLSWKNKYNVYSKNGKLTVFGYLQNKL